MKSLIYAHLEERFGPVVAHVAATLSAAGSVPLVHVVASARLPAKQVRECLVVLIHHQLVESVVPADTGIALFRVSMNALHVSLLLPWLLAQFPIQRDYLRTLIVQGATDEHPSASIACFMKHRSSHQSSFLDIPEAKRVKAAQVYQLSIPHVISLYKRSLIARTATAIMGSEYRPLIEALLEAEGDVTPHQAAAILNDPIDICKERLESLFWAVDWLDRRSIPQLAYRVKWLDLHSFMCRSLLSSFVALKWSASSLRLLNLLRSSGFLQDKTISAKALMPLKEVRERLFLMWLDGVVQLQEIPRTPDRAASKTNFLWALQEESRTRPLMLQKARAELSQSFRCQRERRAMNQSLLDKLCRKDVTLEMLSVHERQAYDLFEADSLQTFTQGMRLLNDLMILKYFR